MFESSGVPKKKKSMLSDRLYNGVKKFTTLVLPGASALYFALAQIWNLPKPEEVVGSISAVTLFLGGLMHISTASYTPVIPPVVGNLVVEAHPEDGTKKILVAHLDDDAKPAQIAGMDQVSFKVGP